MKYKSLNHRKFRLQYHIIFSTKYRKKILEPIRDSLFESFHRSETIGEFTGKWEILKMNIDKDHIHFLVSAYPEVPISSVIAIMKQTSVYDMYQQNYEYMKKFYWCKEHKLWTKAYFVSTIGEVSEKTILDHIENQG